jgi:hypothetical protein
MSSNCDELRQLAQQADKEEGKLLLIQQELERELESAYSIEQKTNIKKKLDANRPKLKAAMDKETKARHKYLDCQKKSVGK